MYVVTVLGGDAMAEFLGVVVRRVRGGLIIAGIGILLAVTGARLTSGEFWGPSVTKWLGGVELFFLTSALSLIVRVAYIPSLFPKVRQKDTDTPDAVERRNELTWHMLTATVVVMVVWFTSPGAWSPYGTLPPDGPK
jgi:hypothetical protein